MKKLLMYLVVISITCCVSAQSPQKMSYQCVVRNASGVLVTNQSVGIRISILQGSPLGSVVYQEIFTPNPLTNANGLVSIEIGGGLPQSGTFSAINWAAGPYFLKTETDPAGGTTYTISGTSQLLSVPYALHSKSAATADYNSLSNLPALSISNWNTAYGWGNHAGLYRPVGYVPSWSEVTSKPSFATVATSGSYTDLTNKPTILNSQWTTSGSSINYTTGSVGIGTTSPLYRLEIYDATYSFLRFLNSTSGSSNTDGFLIGTQPSGSPVWIWNYENSNMHFATNNINRMVINADGKVDIMGGLNVNSAVPDGKALYVNGFEALWFNGTYFSWGYDGTYNYFAKKVTIGNPANPGYMLYVQGDAYATGLWNSSDARFKKNISAIDNSLDKLMKIRGTSFEFRNDEFKNYQFAEGPQFGFIAQELENVLPEVVKTDSNGYKSVNYSSMIPVLLEAVKEQQGIIEKMENKIKDLTNLVNSLLTNQSSQESK